MQSNKSGMLLGVAVAAVIIVGAIAVLGHRSKTADDTAANPRQTDQPVAGEASPSSVVMHDMSFSPASITVKKGATVTWTNQDDVHHDVASDAGSPAGGPSGALIGKGEQISFTFNTVGTFTYHCTPHPFMHGTVIVTE